MMDEIYATLERVKEKLKDETLSDEEYEKAVAELNILKRK